MNTEDTPITELLTRWRDGSRDAENALMTAVYPVLRDLARARLRRNSQDLTLRATELANETYARMVKLHHVDWQSRIHFFAIAAKVIRCFVIDYVRARNSEKHGGNLPFVTLDAISENMAAPLDLTVDWLAVDQALTELEGLDRGCAEVVELKFFSGLTTEEIAQTCASSTATVGRQWRFARAWLADRLTMA